MGDDQEFDQSLCECLFSHEFAMRRLLNLLRNGQSSCTDSECTDLVRPLSGASSNNDAADNFTFLILMLIAAVILYLIRPNSLRQRSVGNTNKHSRDNGSNDGNDPMVN